MKLIITDNYDEMSNKAYEIIKNHINAQPTAIIGFATGSSPLGIYKNIIDGYNNGELSLKGITSINLDEYIGLPVGHHQSYRHFMAENLFNHTDIKPENINFPNVHVADKQKECQRYSDFIKENTPDIQLLGIGSNGHIGFNEPGTPLDKATHIVALDDSTRQANARFFDSIDDVPTHAITMGIKDILSAKSLILVATDTNKAQAIADMIEGPISTDCPASALQTHNDITIIVDKKAASLLKKTYN